MGDTIIILAYGSYDEAELAAYCPRLVYVDDLNRPIARPLAPQASSTALEG